MGIEEAIQRAIVAALKGAPAVMSALGGARVFDRVPPDPQFPYVTVGDDQIIDDSDDCQEGFEVYSTIHAWSRAPSKQEVKGIAAAVRDALNAPLAITDHNLIHHEFQSARVLTENDGLTVHIVLTFRYLVSPAA